jgi:hypothetical protein
MTGIELTAVWLFTIFCAAVTVTSVAKSVAAARVEVAKANAGAYVQAHRVVSEAQFGPTTVPTEWIPGGEL